MKEINSIPFVISCVCNAEADRSGVVTVDTSITFSDDDNYSTNYYSNQKLTLKLSVGDADVLFAPEFVFQQYADAGSLMPLTDYLTADELEQYKDMIVYATDSETGETLPCGLELNDNQWLSDYGLSWSNGDCKS